MKHLLKKKLLKQTVKLADLLENALKYHIFILKTNPTKNYNVIGCNTHA